MNPTRAHELALQDLAARRIVALEDVQRFEKRFERITINLATRTITLKMVDGAGPDWSARWPSPDPLKPTMGSREDRPHDLAAIIKAALRLVGFA